MSKVVRLNEKDIEGLVRKILSEEKNINEVWSKKVYKITDQLIKTVLASDSGVDTELLLNYIKSKLKKSDYEY
jgi:hypothetical protein